MPSASRHTRHRRGSVLFLILLAVALFAALNYAVTSSNGGGTKNASSENQATKASEILNYFSQIDTAIKRMTLTHGIREYEINFFYSGNPVNIRHDNTNCLENRCRIFHPDGGGVSPRRITNMCRDTSISCSNSGNPGRIFLFSIPGAGTSLPDLVWIYYASDIGLCKQINRNMGLSEIINTNVPTENSTTFLYWYDPYPTGPFPDSTITMSAIPQEAGIAGTFCGCPGGTESGCSAHTWAPFIFHVLIAR